MELNGLEADEPLVKTQMTVSKKTKKPKNPTKNKLKNPKHRLQKQCQIKPSKMTNAVTAKRQVT